MDLKLRLDDGPGLVIGSFFLIVVLIAGAAALALLALPGSTGSYFSWTLRPTWAAAVIGGLYLASTVAFAWALSRPRDDVQALAAGVLGLAVPTFVFTIVHAEVFDFGRWQAVFWVVLFALAPVTITIDLVRGRRTPVARSGMSTRGVRLLWGLAAGVATVAAVVVWVRGSTLTIRYLGCWCSFAAVVMGVAAGSGRTSDSRCAAVVVGAVVTGALIGLARGQFA